MEVRLNEEENWLQEENCEFDIPGDILSPSSPRATSTFIQEDDDDGEVFFGPVTDLEKQCHAETIKQEPLESEKLSTDQFKMLQKDSEVVSMLLQSNKKPDLCIDKNSLDHRTESIPDDTQERQPQRPRKSSIPSVKNDASKRRGIPIMAQKKTQLKMPTPRTNKRQNEVSQMQQPSASLATSESIPSISRKNKNLEEKKSAQRSLPKLTSRIAIPSLSRLPKANSGLTAPRKTVTTGCIESTPRLTKSVNDGKGLRRRSMFNSLRNSVIENNRNKPTTEASFVNSTPSKRTEFPDKNKDIKNESIKTDQSPAEKIKRIEPEECDEASCEKIKLDLSITEDLGTEVKKNLSLVEDSRVENGQNVKTTENKIKEECLLQQLPTSTNKENIPQNLIDSPLLQFSPLKQAIQCKHDPFSTGTTPPSLIVLSPVLKPQPVKTSNLIEF